MAPCSKIFNKYKSLGYVSNEIPLVTRYIRRRKEHLVVTSVGRSFHTYGCAHFALLSVSGQHEKEITCLAGDFFHVYSAAGNIVYAWRRGCELKHKYIGHEHPVHIILPFGPNLVTVDEASNLIVWDIKSESNMLQMEFHNDTFQVTAVTHPSTYLNKILLGSEQGSLTLLNIQSQSVIYTFKGWGSGVTVLVQSPALDVVGIGLKNGNIILHNLKFDETVIRFHQDWGPVSSLTFRTDAPFMISGASNGRIVMWDLEKGKVFSQLTDAHLGSVTGLHCLPSEPLMLSSSPDNTLKMWIFDMVDGGARLLRLREGHSAPPNFIRFHGANGHNILSSAGDSTLRIFSTVTETFNKSLGRASYNRKASKRKGKILDDPLVMPPIVRFTSETTREKEWDNIAAIHLGVNVVTTWSYQRVMMGSLKLKHERFKKGGAFTERIKSTPSALCLTHCGNFVVVGYTSGHCDRFNLQSGIHRATYGDTAHDGAVRGLATDSLNQVLITGGGDCSLKWWHFKNTNLLTTLPLEAGVSFIIHHAESGVVAVALEDCSVILVDETDRTILRCFTGHSSRITDASFSPDGRLIVTGGMDRLICTWDIPTGCLVDRFKVESACTSLSFSPTGEYLSTTHVDCLGVYLWRNKMLYTHINLRPLIGDEISEMDMPTGEKETEDADADNDDKDEECQQIGDLATLSGLPSSRWLNLLNIDIVRQRNKAKELVKSSAPAPFFLPTVPALEVRFDLSAGQEKNDDTSSKQFSNDTPFTALVKSTTQSKNYQVVIDRLKSMGPTTINFEIGALSGENTEAVEQFIEIILFMLETGRDLELAQAYLGLTFKIHGSNLIKSPTFRNSMVKLQGIQNSAWQRLETKLFYNLAVIQALKNT